MTTPQAKIAHISFDQDVALVQALLKDLQEEQSALIGADLDKIERLIDQRMQLLQAVSAAAKVRYEALAAAGFQANEQGMSDWLQQIDDTQVTSAWLAFQQQLIRAKELNRLNGMLIGKHMQRNQERLDVLQGKHAAPQMYGRNGQAQGIAQYRSGMAV